MNERFKSYTFLPLSNSKDMAIVDTEDVFKIFEATDSLYIKDNGRVMFRFKGYKGSECKLHRFIMGIHLGDTKVLVDHMEHNQLDNRKSKLRLATARQNLANMRKRSGTSSIYKGVYFNRRDRVWRVSISINNTCTPLGTFRSEIEAAKVYDKRAIEVFGEFALINFPIQKENVLPA